LNYAFERDVFSDMLNGKPMYRRTESQSYGFTALLLLLSSALLFDASSAVCQIASPLDIDEAQRHLMELKLDGLTVTSAIDLRECRLPAIVRLRDEWRIPLPENTAVFVTKLKDPSRKEDYLRLRSSLFHPSKESIRETGKTFSGRFVLVDPQFSQGSLFSGGGYEKILAHELVHAYVISTITAERDLLPRWFHEGLATHLSGMGAALACQEYRHFSTVFEYLEDHTGKEALALFVRGSIQTGKVFPEAVNAIGIKSESDLLMRAASWTDTKRILIIGPILLAAGFWFFRTSPIFRNPHRVFSSSHLLRRAGVGSRKARNEFYLLDRQELREWQSNFQVLMSAFDSFEGTNSLRELHSRHRKSGLDIHSEDPGEVSLAFVFLKGLPRSVRWFLWWSTRQEMSALATLLAQWQLSERTEYRWRKGVSKAAINLLCLWVVCYLLVPTLMTRAAFPIVHKLSMTLNSWLPPW